MHTNNYLKKKVANAAKWSTITEFISKLIVPITNMILARILVPEAFGVIATVSMVISFADMFTDSGFQKYIIQHEFQNEKDKINSINVAFSANFFISLLLWGLISVYSENIANLVGSPGLGLVIIISGFQLPLTSFSSMQMAIYRRNFEYKTLFNIRIISCLIPFVINIPLALSGFSYWSVIIGTIFNLLITAIVLTKKSVWKPKFYLDIKLFNKMLSFTIWTLIESISIWISAWIDVFIIGNIVGSYYLGVYKTSLNTVNSILTIITAIIIPILFATLSRLQENIEEFNNVYFKAQKILAYFIFPLSLGIFCYRDSITKILLGGQWESASEFIGIWAIISSIKIVLADPCSEYYRSNGLPKLSFFVQIIFLLMYIPLCKFSTTKGIEYLIYSCMFLRLLIVMVHNICMRLKFNIKLSVTIKNVIKPFLATIVMGFIIILLKLIENSLVWDFFSICLSIVIYFLIVYLLDKEDVLELMGVILK